MFVWFFLILAFFAKPLRAEVCVDLGKKVEAGSREVNDMISLRNELDERFKTSVADDFKSQSEGIIDEIHRNQALKAAFAKKKLKRNLEEKMLALLSLKNEFCRSCRSDVRAPDRRVSFCVKCPLTPGCVTD